MTVVELRVLDGPNLYFTRPAIKLTLGVAPWLALPDGRAERLTRRKRILVARSVHPQYRQVLGTYAKNLDLQVEEIAYTSSGQVDAAALSKAGLANAAAVVVQSPNFFGVLEELPSLAELAHASGALLVTTLAEAASLGIVRPPAEADIVAIEAQSFGIPPSYGGPFVGVIATHEKFVRQMNSLDILLGRTLIVGCRRDLG